MIKPLFSLVILLTTLTGVVIVRLYLEGQGEYQRGLRALSERSPDDAATHFQRSLKYYLPGASYVELAARELTMIGLRARKEGNLDLALRCFYEIRASFYSARSLFSPGAAWIELADRELRGIWRQKGKDPGMGTEPDKGPAWGLAAEIGLLGWIGSTVGLIWRAFSSEGKASLQRALPWTLALVGSYGLWVVALGRA